MNNFATINDLDDDAGASAFVGPSFGAAHRTSMHTAAAMPVVTGVAQASGDGYYLAGAMVQIAVTFDQSVTVGGGTPRLLLETGATDQYATYVSGSGTTVLNFSYSVQAGDTSADLQYASSTALELNGATIQLASDTSVAADLGLPALASLVSLAGSSAVIIDTTAPTGSTPDLAAASDTGSSSTDNLTKAATPTFTGSTEAGATVTLYDSNGTSVLGSTMADGSGNWSVTASTLSEGMHTIYTKVTDVAGNTGGLSTGLGITLDVTAPAIGTPDLMNASDSGVSSSDNLTNKITPNFTGTAEASSTVTLYDTNGSTVLGTTTANGMGKWTITSSTLSEGAHMVSAKASDTAGNISSASSKLTVTIDTTAPLTAPAVPTLDPGTDSGVSNSDNITNVSGPCFNGTGANSNSWVNVYADGTLLGTTLSDGSGNYTYSATFLADGDHLITAKNVDNAGNIGPASSAQTVTIDMTTPTTTIATFSFSIDSGVSATDFITNKAAQTLSGTTTANLASSEIVEVSLDNGGAWVTATSAAGKNAWSLAGLTLTGSDTLQVRVSDLAGNANTALTQAYVLDTTAPTTTVTSVAFSADTGTSSSDFTTKTASQTISGALDANLAGGDVVEVSLDAGATWHQATTTGKGWSLAGQTLTASSTLIARVSDAAGNTTTATQQAYVYDNVAPTLSITSNVASLKIGETATITFTASDAPGTALAWDGSAGNVSVSGGTLGALSGSGLTRTATFTPTAGVNGGMASITVAAGVFDDAAGNHSGAGATPTLVFDTLAPAAPSAPALASGSDTGVSNSDQITSATTPVFTGTAEAGATVTLYDSDGTTVLGSQVASGGSWSITSSALSAGDHTVSAKATDAAGNQGGAASVAVHILTGAPTLAITSDKAQVGAGETATITFTFSRDPGASFSWDGTAGDVVVSGGTLGAISGSGLTRTATFTPPASGSGTASVTVAASSYTDLAGNAGSAGATPTLAYSAVATAAPGAPLLATASDSGSSHSDGITNAATLTFTGSGIDGATVTLYDGSNALGTATVSGGSWSVSAALGEATHSLNATQSVAGNTSAHSAGTSVTVDRTAPGAPSLSLAAASDTGALGDNATELATPTISGAAEAHATVSLYDGATLLASALADANGAWSISAPALAPGSHALSARQADLAGNVSAAAALALTILAEPAPGPLIIDGVPVTVAGAVLPDGSGGTVVTVPVIAPGRIDQTGAAGVADVPLASSGGATLLLAQIPVGYGLTSTGGDSVAAGAGLAQLDAAIRAATATQGAADQTHLTDVGALFINALAGAPALLVRTVAISAGADPASAPLQLTATSNAGQQTALVIDATHLPSGGTLTLSGAGFAAIIGSASVTGAGAGQVLAGDGASQRFSVAAVNGALVYAGGGDDLLSVSMPVAAPAAAPRAADALARPAAAPVAGQTLLHGGTDADTALFAGSMASYTISYHNGYQLISSKAAPTVQAMLVNVETLKFSDATVAVPDRVGLDAIAALYQSILGRQADVFGFDYWGGVQQQGATLGQIALQMIGSSEAAGHGVGAFTGNAAHDAELLYNAILGRHADSAGLAFWTDQIAHGASLQAVAGALAVSVEMVGHYKAATQWDFVV